MKNNDRPTIPSLDPTFWVRTATTFAVDFYTCAINGIEGGSPATQLESLGKPDYPDGVAWCYCDLGLEFQVIDPYIAYIYIHIQASNQSFFNKPYHFAAYSGQFLYNGLRIDNALLQDCDALIASFHSPQYKLHYERLDNRTGKILDKSYQVSSVGSIHFGYNGTGLARITLY